MPSIPRNVYVSLIYGPAALLAIDAARFALELKRKGRASQENHYDV